MYNLRSLREDAGYSQTMLAAIVGVGQAEISNYECGRRKIPFDVAIDICNCLNVDDLRDLVALRSAKLKVKDGC